MMNWNDDRTLDEVEAGIVSPERFGGIMPEGELTFRELRIGRAVGPCTAMLKTTGALQQ